MGKNLFRTATVTGLNCSGKTIASYVSYKHKMSGAQNYIKPISWGMSTAGVHVRVLLIPVLLLHTVAAVTGST